MLSKPDKRSKSSICQHDRRTQLSAMTRASFVNGRLKAVGYRNHRDRINNPVGDWLNRVFTLFRQNWLRAECAAQMHLVITTHVNKPSGFNYQNSSTNRSGSTNLNNRDS
jgi:hypothetical protein